MLQNLLLDYKTLAWISQTGSHVGFVFDLYSLNDYNVYNIPIQASESINSPAATCPGQGNWPRALFDYAHFPLAHS